MVTLQNLYPLHPPTQIPAKKWKDTWQRNGAKNHPRLLPSIQKVLRFKSGTQFSSDSLDGTGMSLDLSSGVFAEVSTGGTEDVFDGDSNFSVSMWVKGWPSAGNSLINKDKFDPANMVT